MNPFRRISARVLEDHQLYGQHVESLPKLYALQRKDFQPYIALLLRHRTECALCRCPRFHKLARRVLRAARLIFIRIRFPRLG